MTFAQKKNSILFTKLNFSRGRHSVLLGLLLDLGHRGKFIAQAGTQRSSGSGWPAALRASPPPRSCCHHPLVPSPRHLGQPLTLHFRLHPTVTAFVLLAHILLVQAEGMLSVAKNPGS